MKNTYVFLIWNKALWCKDKIIRDISKSFNILNYFYIQWDKEKFPDNLKAFYGRKIGLTSEKIANCGNGKFLFILVEDLEPKFETRDMYDGQETVNSHIYDKKMLYRKWTAGAHRIHCSDTEKETAHDLSLLFGYNYEQKLKLIQKNSIVNTNVSSLNGFDSIEELKLNLDLFGDTITYLNNNNLFIFTKNRKDIEFYLFNSKQIRNNYFIVDMESNIYNIYIFGENDGDIPLAFINNSNPEIINTVISNINSFLDYLQHRKEIPKNIKATFLKYNLDIRFKEMDAIRKEKKSSLFRRLKIDFKLLYAKIKYYCSYR